MERIKTIILTMLVILSVFLSYKLLYRPTREIIREIEVDGEDIFSYKRLYQIRPNREYLSNIPSSRLNEFLVNSLLMAENIVETSPLDSEKFINKGYYAEFGFNVPVSGLFRSFKKSIPNLPFDSIKTYYMDNEKKVLTIETEKFTYIIKTDNSLELEKPSEYVEYDKSFLPSNYRGINSFAVEANPFMDYSKGDRYNFAEEFLDEENIQEIEEEEGWLYSASSASIFLSKDGTAVYRHRPNNPNEITDIYESLLALKKFIKTAPLKFSSYRIVGITHMVDNDKKVLKVSLLQNRLPQFASTDPFFEIHLLGKSVIYFKYNANYARDYRELFRNPDIDKYRNAMKYGLDPFPFYKRGKRDDGVLKLEIEHFK